MIQVLILEDEEPAAKRLKKLLLEATEETEVLAVLESIKAAKEWFANNKQPQLLLADIHLADGMCFELFKQIDITCPVIFTTAYDEYALQAFKLNSIDYLLKPIKKDELQQALKKYKKINSSSLNINQLLQAVQTPVDKYRQRFIIRYGEHIKTIETKDIAYFYTETRSNFIVTDDGKRYVVDFNLDQIQEMIDPAKYYRINRQFIIGIHAISQMTTWTKGRVHIQLNPPAKQETIVSTERSADFKKWLGGELPIQS